MDMTDKDKLEREHSQQMNDDALKRVEEEMTKEESERLEKIFFEDCETVTLRDGKEYKIPPCTLRDARNLMNSLKVINLENIVLNFMPTGDEEEDKHRIDTLFKIILIGFVNYPNIDRDYIDRYVDVVTAGKVIDTLLGINLIKK